MNICDSWIWHSPHGEPTFNLYLDSIVEYLCKPWVGLSCNVLCSVLLYCCDHARYVDVKVCNCCALFPQARWVASLRPRLGGEPPWFYILSLITGFCLRSWTFGTCEVSPMFRKREHYCLSGEWREKLHLVK